MRRKINHLLIAALSGNLLLAQGPGGAVNGQDIEKRRAMTRIKLGRDAKMTALPAERERIQKFYGDVLGCKVGGQVFRLVGMTENRSRWQHQS